MKSIFNIFFFNKVLMGPVNSTQDLLNSTYCLLKVEMRASKKEKKKKQTQLVKHQSKCILRFLNFFY